MAGYASHYPKGLTTIKGAEGVRTSRTTADVRNPKALTGKPKGEGLDIAN